MDHEPVLISTIAIGLTAAFIGGLLARRVNLPSIVGYILAGIVLGPFTPGLTADSDLANELAEIGVILLMFGVGIEFSPRDLNAVRGIAIPGAAIQVAVATTVTVLGAMAFGWTLGAGLVLGLSVSIASTVVLLRALATRNEIDTPQGRIAIGWLIVEDIFTIVALVVLPALAPVLAGDGATDALGTVADVAIAVGKAAIFAVLMVVAGARLVPRLLLVVAHEGSRELFTLAVLAIALGIAFVASTVFGVSFALGAFLAGAVVGESDMSHQAAADALPLRDAFAVLFFVSVGMLFDPAFFITHLPAVFLVLALIVLGKALLKFAVVIGFGYPIRTALTVGVGLAQIGEFSFILGTVGRQLGLIDEEAFQLIVAGSLLSIAVNPFLFWAIDPLERRLRDFSPLSRWLERRGGRLAVIAPDDATALRNHAIVCGYGRVGRMIVPALDRRGFRYVVITLQRREVEQLRARGATALYGDASSAEVLERAHVEHARLIIIASSDPHVTRLIVERALVLNPTIDFVVRTQSDAESAQLRSLSSRVQSIHGGRELAVQMARYSLRRFGVPSTEAEAIAQGLRRAASYPADATPPSAASTGTLARIRARIGAGRS